MIISAHFNPTKVRNLAQMSQIVMMGKGVEIMMMEAWMEAWCSMKTPWLMVLFPSK
jgi:hypothetical protein